MSYNKGDLVTAQDYNTLVSKLMYIYDVGHGATGYGQGSGLEAQRLNLPTLSYVSPNDIITAKQWTDLLEVMDVLDAIQGTSNNRPHTAFRDDFKVGNFIKSPIDHGVNLPEYIKKYEDNKDNIQFTPSVLNTVLRTPSTGLNYSEVFITWPNEDEARYFFNSGGLLSMISSGGHVSTSNNDPDDDNASTLYGDMLWRYLYGYSVFNKTVYHNLPTYPNYVALKTITDYPSSSQDAASSAVCCDDKQGINGGNGKTIRLKFPTNANVSITRPYVGFPRGASVLEPTYRVDH